jgi:acyl-CoA thioester hydrolase
MREAPPSLAQFTWKTRHDIRFADLDLVGHVNNGAYISLMETNRTRLFAENGLARGPLAQFVLARFEIDFLQELHWPAMVAATSGLEREGSTSMIVKQGVFAGETCLAWARAIIVAIDPETRKPTPVPAEAVAIARRYPLLAT